MSLLHVALVLGGVALSVGLGILTGYLFQDGEAGDEGG
jgi:hypothetical protein